MDFLTFQIRAAIIGNYKQSRLFDRGNEYAEAVIKSAIEDVIKYGEIIIAEYESKSGEEIKFIMKDDCLVLFEQ